jgi:hypothetical protein
MGLNLMATVTSPEKTTQLNIHLLVRFHGAFLHCVFAVVLASENALECIVSNLCVFSGQANRT